GAAGRRRRTRFGQPRHDRRGGDLGRRLLDPAVAVRGTGVLCAAGAVYALAQGARAPGARTRSHGAPGRERGVNDEQRLYGINAVRAAFARRPQALRKLYLAEARIPQLQPLLKWCVANRIGYRVVAEEDLRKLAASSHHEGVVADMLREEPQPLTSWLRDLGDGPQCALWLDGVGNPHNLGAILRSAAHFGVGAILLPKHSTLALSGAAARVAEGGAEAVPFVRLGRDDN